MDIPRTTREEFNALSKEIFGSASRWKKILDRGQLELITRTVVETVPGEEGQEATTKEVQVPVLTESGVKQYRAKYYNLDTLKVYLLDLKAQRDAFIAQIQKQNEEAQAKLKAEADKKKLQEDLTGSALLGEQMTKTEREKKLEALKIEIRDVLQKHLGDGFITNSESDEEIAMHLAMGSKALFYGMSKLAGVALLRKMRQLQDQPDFQERMEISVQELTLMLAEGAAGSVESSLETIAKVMDQLVEMSKTGKKPTSH